MRKNVGSTERIVRLAMGAGLTYLALTRWRDTTWRRRLALSSGLELLSTVLTQTCPGNALLGRDTYQVGGREHARRSSEDEDGTDMRYIG